MTKNHNVSKEGEGESAESVAERAIAAADEAGLDTAADIGPAMTTQEQSDIASLDLRVSKIEEILKANGFRNSF